MTSPPIPASSRDIRRILTELGYEEDKQVTQLFGERRMLFHDPVFDRHADVFFNALDFCHTLSFVGRLEQEAVDRAPGGAAAGEDADRPDQ